MFIAGYLLLTHGKTPGAKLAEHPAGRLQLANLRAHARFRGAKLVTSFDYARRVRSLDDLPRLREWLAAPKARPVLVMDDICRLMRPVPVDDRGDFLDALLPHGPRIFSLRHGCSLATFPATLRSFLLAGGDRTPWRLEKRSRSQLGPEARQAQTAAAVSASLVARRKRLAASYRQLEEVKSTLLKAGAQPTLAAIADAANHRGLRTPRGKSYTVSSVHRVLKDGYASVYPPGWGEY